MKTTSIIVIVIGVIIVVAAGVGGALYLLRAPQTISQRTTNVQFTCDNNKTIAATFYPDNDTHVDLQLSDGRKLSVPHASSASGARYATADESFVFWNKGDTAFITEGQTTTYENCTLKGSTPPPQKQSVSDGTITIPYADPFGLATKPEQVPVHSYIPPCDPTAFDYCVYYAGTAYKGTNFESAGIRIQKRADLSSERLCLNTPPAGFDASMKPDNTTSTNTYSMSVFSNVSDAAAGHYSAGSLYRLFVRSDSSCYEFETRIGQSRFENYPTGTIKKFTDQDSQQLMTQMKNLLEGITLPNNQPIQFP
jgi:membrane-bound inhibitor of C-type lysozyme